MNSRIKQLAFAVLVLAVISGCASPTPRDAAFGVVLMAHGGSEQWNQRVLAAVEPLQKQYAIAVAFGMADAQSLQDSVDALERRGVRRIGVVRLFVSGESWYERTEQILGMKPGAPSPPADGRGSHAHHEHSMAFWQIKSDSTFALSREGLADAPEMDAVLVERVLRLSRDPSSEDVLILAHGPGDDDENARWIEKITARSASIKRAHSFRRVEVQTLREDWPDKRVAAETAVRAFVQRAQRELGRAVVVPFRVEGFGPYAGVLQELDYVADGMGLLPHPNVTHWIARQIDELQTQLTAIR